MATPQANSKTATNGSDSAAAANQNKANSHIPEWLNAQLFEELLQQNVSTFRSIKEFKVQPAMAAGENYATIMLRIEIELELQDNTTKSVSYLMKVGHDYAWVKELSKRYNPFAAETDMYVHVVPEFEELYRNVGVDIKFGCQHFKLNIDHELILLEDLRPRGFKNANRLEGLDMEHTESVLKKLAQWHAASAVRVETKGRYTDMYEKGFFTDGSQETIKMMLASMAEAFQRCLSSYEGHELYEEAVIKTQSNIIGQMYKDSKPEASEFNVLNHGDCWCNNIMFQYDAFGKIKETYFVDYQIPKYGSPAQDLLYFLISSIKYELKLKQFEYFIKFYHNQLVEHLQLLKYSKKVPSLKEIHIMLYKYGYWGLYTAAGVMAAALLDPNENATLDNFFADSDAGQKLKLQLFSTARYRKHIEVVLPWLYNRGALEL